MTQQGLRHASAIAQASAVAHPNIATYDYNSAFHALFDASLIPVGDFNSRLFLFLTLQLPFTPKTLDEAMNEFAIAQGAIDWDGLGAFTV